MVVWQGLKTGMYYLRSRGAADAIKFTVDASKVKKFLSLTDLPSPYSAAKLHAEILGLFLWSTGGEFPRRIGKHRREDGSDGLPLGEQG